MIGVAYPKRAIAFCTALSALIAISCASGNGTNQSSEPLDTPFEIKVGQSVDLEDTDWSLRLQDITADSRCPVDATCVWAGEVTASFTALPRSGAGIEVRATLGPATDARAYFDTFVLTVQAVSPQPKATAPIASSDYLVTVVVERVAGGQDQSGVQGVVTRGPMCPVYQPSQPCPDEPFEAEILVTDGGGRVVARVTSGPDGRYRLPLPAGTYSLLPQTPPGNILPTANEVSLIIKDGEWVTVDISYDTGIR